jgi:ELWxxDGT repeat protein
MSRERSATVFLAVLLTTAMAMAPAPGRAQDASAGDFIRLGDRLIFSTLDTTAGGILWSTDGTAAGTLPLSFQICPSPCQDVRPLGTAGNAALFAASPGRLWRTDGTPAGTFPVSGPIDFIGETAKISPDGLLFFEACGPFLGCELWRSDGTRAGTRVARDIVPGADGSSPHALTPWNGRLYFLAEGESGADSGLWSSDGTAAGTRFVAPSVNNFTNGNTVLAATPSRLFFTSLNVTEQLWTSDGTPPGGSRLLHRFQAPPCTEPDLCQGPYLNFLEPVGNLVIFTASDGVHGPQIWASDGTRTGTRPLTALRGNVLAGSPVPRMLGSRWIFPALAGPKASSPVLWTADAGFAHPAPLTGCAGGCPAVFYFFPPPASGTAPGRLLFVGSDAAHGAELWTTDGTAAGTRRLSDVCAGPCSAFSQYVPPAVLGDAGGRTYFLAATTADGTPQDLWVTDGTPAGTRRISGFTRGAGILDGLLYYGVTGASGLELWVTDGTAAGSHPVTVLLPAPAG